MKEPRLSTTGPGNSPGPEGPSQPQGSGKAKDPPSSRQLDVNVTPRWVSAGVLLSASAAGLALAGVPIWAVFIAGHHVSSGYLIASVVSGIAVLITTLIAWAWATARGLKVKGHAAKTSAVTNERLTKIEKSTKKILDNSEKGVHAAEEAMKTMAPSAPYAQTGANQTTRPYVLVVWAGPDEG